MFNEKSTKWIKILKAFTIVVFFVFLLTSIVLCIISWTGAELLFDDAVAFLEGLVFLAAGTILAFSQLVINMLIIQLLNNVQIIREGIENK